MYSIQSFSQSIVETDYYASHTDLGGDVVINKSTKEVEGNKAIVSFEIEAPTAGEYYVSFWLFPTKLSDGTFAHYDVSANGNLITDKIIPIHGDWQAITLSQGGKISLNKGVNTVSIIGEVPDVPNVEHIRLSSVLQKAQINSAKYDLYKTAVVQESITNIAENLLLTTSTSSDTLSTNNFLMANATSTATNTDNPLYNYSYMLDVNFNYTFYKTVSFTEGQQIFLATNGVNNFSHILELFSSTSPENYSWTAMSNSNCMASLNITIPQTGMYYVRVRSYLNAHSGLCNLNINGQNYYENIPIFSVGVRYTQDTDKTYNTFTCKNTGDPRLWIEEGSSIPGKISAFNDDYGKIGDFSWGLNSRIKKKYTRPVHAVLLSAYSSYNPTGKCDLYIKCQNSTVMPYFSNLKEDDAIQSAPASDVYNCISWSGAITSYWEWPPYVGSSFYSPNPLTAFDNFYASRGFTRSGATESNAVVALWANVSASGDRNYTHGSVTKGADDNAHGYDWESKPGALMRTFHPRDALNGSSYGQIVEYYRKANTSVSSFMTLEEEIADGIAQIEYVDFDSDENEVIAQKINTINNNVLSQFRTLYNQWRTVTENTIYSNPEQIANCQEYVNVLNFCKSNPILIYAIYQELGNGDNIAAIKLIEDLTLSDNLSVMQSVRENSAARLTRSSVKTVRPIHSNFVAYVKELLAIENVELAKTRKISGETTGISYSNFTEFSYSSSAGTLFVNFTLNSTSKVSLNLLDLSGNIICCALNGKTLNSGDYSFKLKTVNGNIYLVQLIIDGHVNVKKVIIK